MSVAFMVLGYISGAVYYVLCLIGYGEQGGGWFVAALVIPPLDVMYPFAAPSVFDEPFPLGLLMLGIGSMVSMGIAAWLGEKEAA
jgi:hypothetical protein